MQRSLMRSLMLTRKFEFLEYLAILQYDSMRSSFLIKKYSMAYASIIKPHGSHIRSATT